LYHPIEESGCPYYANVYNAFGPPTLETTEKVTEAIQEEPRN
jgi:hypothetical protein